MPASRSFVLVPGAGGSPWFWHRLVAELESRGHVAVAVDLPAEDEGADLSDYVDAVVAAAGDRRDLVMVAQSLGGFTAVPACQRLPVSLLVFVNAMIPDPGETAGDWWANSGQRDAMKAMDQREGRGPDAEFDVMTYFLHDLPPEVLVDAEANARGQTDKPFATPAAFESWPDIPTRVIVGRDDRFFPAEFQRAVSRDRLGIEPDLVPGGHCLTLSHPIELADQLESYLAV
jgi:pimeloyl-ACP methyl ester carboxylesterase